MDVRASARGRICAAKQPSRIFPISAEYCSRAQMRKAIAGSTLP
ncbi:hypothetical protein TSAR_007240 [Trichomalopsis sarcophagae]|uniref:Uncharacterized protein n=1 Tax=Trichomalopsis sarcophagae TaxID=543379 RepID=A0A232F1S3_9HYME|nr:hypothetical protein TSAR_007240 [Trichomalopsis sarcophagae]